MSNARAVSDLAILLTHFGAPSGLNPSKGDIDDDGAIDLFDLTFLLSHFGP